MQSTRHRSGRDGVKTCTTSMQQHNRLYSRQLRHQQYISMLKHKPQMHCHSRARSQHNLLQPVTLCRASINRLQKLLSQAALQVIS